MKFLSLLALLPFLALSYDAQAHRVASEPPAEDALTLPWDRIAMEDVNPSDAAVKLLATLHIGSRVDTFNIPLSNCGNDIQSVNLKITGASVTVQSFGIKFTDGNTRDFAVNRTYAAGTDSGWLDLGIFRAMDSRCPANVYAKGNSAGNAVVYVYGNLK